MRVNEFKKSSQLYLCKYDSVETYTNASNAIEV
ncbi:hypothetical protein M2145_002994 [Lachnospiraceae bacterium PF1-21]